MNSFRTWLNNPNVHLYTALALGIASVVPALAPFAKIIQAVGLTLTTTGALLPEKGSLHQQDYANIAATVAGAIAASAKTVETQGRT